jgi:hypothetical protein
VEGRPDVVPAHSLEPRPSGTKIAGCHEQSATFANEPTRRGERRTRIRNVLDDFDHRRSVEPIGEAILGQLADDDGMAVRARLRRSHVRNLLSDSIPALLLRHVKERARSAPDVEKATRAANFRGKER